MTDVAGIMNITHVAEIVKLSHVAKILEARSMYDPQIFTLTVFKKNLKKTCLRNSLICLKFFFKIQ